MAEEKVWFVNRNGGAQRVRAEKVHFLGDSYKSDRLLKFETKGQVKAAYAAGTWISVHLEGALIDG